MRWPPINLRLAGPARVERLDGAHFRLTIFPPLPVTRSGEPHADAAALMARVNATLEVWIRDRPEQWLWVHRCHAHDLGRIDNPGRHHVLILARLRVKAVIRVMLVSQLADDDRALLITTEAMIGDRPEPKGTPGMPPGGMGGMDY